jgi:hypothetical protein
MYEVRSGESKKETSMKRTVTGLVTLVALAALVIMDRTSLRIVRTVHAGSGCAVASLSGNYAASQSGFESKTHQNGSLLPFATLGLATFDGAGNFSITYTDMSPGQPSYIAVQGNGSGTYTVNSDCSGSISVTAGDAAGLTLNLQVIGGGTEVFGISTTPFIVANSDFKKQ